MIILGISAYYHDSAAAILVDGKIVAAVQEERFTRTKHTAEFPTESIKHCLNEAKINLENVDLVVFYEKPFLKFERLLETYLHYAPKGVFSFIKSMPVWLGEKLFLKDKIYKGLKSIDTFNKIKTKLLFSEHHLSHAASAYYPSGFSEAAILTIDGVGEWCTASLSFAKDGKIEILKELNFPNSLGLLYSAFTYYLGFTVNSGEYKVMGLAPYGNKNSNRTLLYIDKIKQNLITIYDDGSIYLNQEYFNYTSGLTMTRNNKWNKLFGLAKRNEADSLKQEHCDLALALQIITEEIVIRMAHELKQLTNTDNLCLAGGVALNCVANAKLRDEKLFKDIYIQPSSGDAGAALGAALAVQHLYVKMDFAVNNNLMQGTYLGPLSTSPEVLEMCKDYKAVYTQIGNNDELCKFTAQKIADANVIGWFQGRMEFGPRALGNRSILADPRNSEMQKNLNLKIKFRESFRPFAPAVLEEDAQKYFCLDKPSPYMLFTADLKKERQILIKNSVTNSDLENKINEVRSDLPAITHIDYSARVQTVNKLESPLFHQLINEFKTITGTAVLINTSFNVRGEPIVCNAKDAYECFMNTNMDYLIINKFVFCKTDQPEYRNKERWGKKFKSD